MNVTLSLDGQLLDRARKVAAARGKSLNQVIREYLEEMTGGSDPAAETKELRDLSRTSAGRSKGAKIVRDELHERGPRRRP
jgi:hypothetical protein